MCIRDRDNIVLACTESSTYSTFWVMAVGCAPRFLNCRQAEVKKFAPCSVSKTI